MHQYASAPPWLLKQPDTFCLTFTILRSRSAWLLSKGTVTQLDYSLRSPPAGLQYDLAVAHKVHILHLSLLTLNPLNSYKWPIVW